MEETEKSKILGLYPEFKDIYGPYSRKDGRRIVILYDGDRRSARQLAKVRLEVALGRRLVGRETVDHVDEDFRNDDPSNLQLLSRSENSRKSSLGNTHSLGRIVPEEERSYGEKNSRALLTNSQVEAFRHDFSSGIKSKSDIIEETGMSDKAVRNFLYGSSYKDAGSVVEKRKPGRPPRK